MPLLLLLAAAQIHFASQAILAGPVVRLGDVADLRAVPAAYRDRAASLVVARLTLDRSAFELDGDAMASRARAQMPVLGPLLPNGIGPIAAVRHASLPFAPRVLSQGAADIKAGDPIAVEIAAGNLRIVREAVALQPGGKGQKMFVKVDGGVLSASCCGEVQ
jgi:hypothetical protein